MFKVFLLLTCSLSSVIVTTQFTRQNCSGAPQVYLQFDSSVKKDIVYKKMRDQPPGNCVDFPNTNSSGYWSSATVEIPKNISFCVLYANSNSDLFGLSILAIRADGQCKPVLRKSMTCDSHGQLRIYRNDIECEENMKDSNETLAVALSGSQKSFNTTKLGFFTGLVTNYADSPEEVSQPQFTALILLGYLLTLFAQALTLVSVILSAINLYRHQKLLNVLLFLMSFSWFVLFVFRLILSMAIFEKTIILSPKDKLLVKGLTDIVQALVTLITSIYTATFIITFYRWSKQKSMILILAVLIFHISLSGSMYASAHYTINDLEYTPQLNTWIKLLPYWQLAFPLFDFIPLVNVISTILSVYHGSFRSRYSLLLKIDKFAGIAIILDIMSIAIACGLGFSISASGTVVAEETIQISILAFHSFLTVYLSFTVKRIFEHIKNDVEKQISEQEKCVI